MKKFAILTIVLAFLFGVQAFADSEVDQSDNPTIVKTPSTETKEESTCKGGCAVSFIEKKNEESNEDSH